MFLEEVASLANFGCQCFHSLSKIELGSSVGSERVFFLFSFFTCFLHQQHSCALYIDSDVVSSNYFICFRILLLLELIGLLGDYSNLALLVFTV